MPFQPAIEEPSNICRPRTGGLDDAGGKDVLLDAAHVDEAQVDVLDLVVPDEFLDVFERHGWLRRNRGWRCISNATSVPTPKPLI